MKRILVIYFSQSGQQKHILEALIRPIVEAGNEVHFEEIKPVQKFPFPWDAYRFFNAFPETFMQQPLALEPVSAKAHENYDLVILGYQPWFLSPSRPISSFLQSPEGKKILKDKPVITILGCRNMWLSAQEKVKQWLLRADAKLVGHIALIDHSSNVISLITILHWMLTGKKEPFWIFPEAGVANHDVQHASVYGSIIKVFIAENRYDGLQNILNEKGAVEIKPNLVLMERRGRKSFSVWAKFVAMGGVVNSGGRKFRLYMFMFLLPTLIILLTPLLWILSTFQLIIKKKELLREIDYFKQLTLRESAKSI
jgi:hypothetical protein